MDGASDPGFARPRAWPRLRAVRLEPAAVLGAVQRLRPIADGLGVTMAQLALAWVLRESNVASAIVGASRPEQVEENAAASGVELDAATLEAIDEAVAGVVVT